MPKKRVHKSKSYSEALAIQEYLRANGIDAGVEKEEILGSGGNIFPTGSGAHEVFVLLETDLQSATELMPAFFESREAQSSGSSWVCSACGEDLEPQFSSCWKCGKDRG